MKCAKVFPIFKGGNKSDPSNYRPISILSTISKIFERHVNKHLMNYLTKYKLIHEHQSGFRKKHSCQTALVKLIDQWMSCINKGDFVGTLFLDLRKAFDVVDNTILIENWLHTNLVTRLSNGLNPILMDEDRQFQMEKVSLSL